MSLTTFATYIRVNNASFEAPEKAAVFSFDLSSSEDLPAAIETSGVTADDMRSATAVVFASDVDQAVLAAVYSFAAALAGRWLTVIVDGKEFEVGTLSESIRDRARNRPAVNDKLLSVGFVSDEIPAVALGGSDIPALNAAMDRVQYAKDVLITSTSTPVALVATLVAVADLRRRPGLERPGTFVSGETSVDLASIRHLAMPLRGKNKIDAELAPAVKLSERQTRLVDANAVDMEATLELLGARRGPEHKQVWHCTRPTRHTNGDRVASMRIKDGLVRCMRCDGEPVGPLRLTADTLAITVDEAADYLLRHLAK